MRRAHKNKQEIILYILEKIQLRCKTVSKDVSDTYGISQNTVHAYINELVQNNIIQRVKRGEYLLKESRYEYVLDREKGDLDSDMYAYQECLQEHIDDLPDNVQAIWEYVFSEMINNVMDHSQAQKVTIEVQKDYLTTSVRITDNGIGIFKKIKEHFHYASLDEAIAELFKGKLTTDPKNHSGEGIFFSSKMVDTFFILSDNKIFTNNKYEDELILDLGNKGIEGTCVIMSLSNYTHKTPREVFDQYADVDGAFTRTRIPLKNIFDSSPVSRSQAKRVSNRLEKFDEIILDFEGVEWMGQGFAHQLFVVFANEHPKIKLVPINMNEDVDKMYYHVIN